MLGDCEMTAGRVQDEYMVLDGDEGCGMGQDICPFLCSITSVFFLVQVLMCCILLSKGN
jgi:hypothetical protein